VKVLAAEFLRRPSISGGRLLLKHFIALGERDPGLLSAGPDVPARPQPGRIVKGACPDPDQAIPRRAGNPRAAFRANPSRAGSTAIGESLKRTWLDAAEPEALLDR
jgi:hypothetical protein